MYRFVTKASAAAVLAGVVLAGGAATASAASGPDAQKTSALGKGVSVSLSHFKGGTLVVGVDATGKAAAEHQWVLTVNGKKFASGSYQDKSAAKVWTFKDAPRGDVKLTAPPAKGQTTVFLDVK